MAKQQKNAPEKVFRIGYVSASVFLNEANSDGGSRNFRSVNVQRSYRDGEDTKFSSSFTLADLPQSVAARLGRIFSRDLLVALIVA